ncbi:hypothetical protein FRB95_007394 [Tulasnella sp. JGI-2019a]|nr:hypothetical protein FRB95_007394 [Tulasnella sp. JGI-2019a]
MQLEVSAPLALLLVGTCIFTTTISHHHPTLRWLRLILAAPACAAALCVAYPTVPAETRPGIRSQFALCGFILLMRTLEVCVVGFWDEQTGETWPRWQVRKEKSDGVEYVKLPLPTDLKGRLAYTLDNIISSRGSSIFAGCSWNWAEKRIRDYNPSRSAYLRSMMKSVILWYLLGDVIEHFLYSRNFDSSIPHPITSRPLPQQIIAALALPAYSYAGTELLSTSPSALILVGIFGLPPSACPPIFAGHPFQSASIAEFWSLRWHTWFRRSFDRLSLPVIWILRRIETARGHPFSTRTISFIRTFTIFSISALIHVGVTYTIPSSPNRALHPFKSGQVTFFLVQPFGLWFEATVVKSVTDGMPERWRMLVRRSFAWAWMVWTGRWIADWYALLGLFEERTLPFSPVMFALEHLDLK